MTLNQNCPGPTAISEAERQKVPKPQNGRAHDQLGQHDGYLASAAMPAAPPVRPASDDVDGLVTRYRDILLAGSSASCWEELADDEKHRWRQAYRYAPAHSYARTLLHAATIHHGGPEPHRTLRWADFTGQVFHWSPGWSRWESGSFSYSWERIPSRHFPLVLLPSAEHQCPLAVPSPRAAPPMPPASGRNDPPEHGTHPVIELGCHTGKAA
jgi:hypothetical protein